MIGRARRHAKFAYALFVAMLFVVGAGPLAAAEPAATLKHDLAVTLRPAERRMDVRDVVEAPASLFEGDRITFETASFITDLDVRVLSGGRRLSVSGRDGGEGRLWEIRIGRAPRAGGKVVLEYLNSIVDPRSAQLAIRPGGSLAGGSGDAWYPQIGYSFPEVGRITMNVPPGETAIASGTRASTPQQEAAGRFVFEVTLATKFAFASGPYVRHVSPDGRFAFYALGQRPNAQNWLELSAAVVAELERLYGPAPAGTPALVEVDFPTVVLGASEQGFILSDESQLREFNPLYWAHEFAHQYWGMMLRSAPGTPARTLFTESLSEFSALLVVEALHGRAAIADLRLARFPAVPASPIDRFYALAESGGDRSLRDWTPGSGDEILTMHRLSTSKGAWVMAMLADLVGRDVVLAGLNRLLRDRAGATASWADVEQAVSASAGRDLEWFFAQWLGRPGAADLRLDWTAESGGVGGAIVQLGGPYRLEVEVDLLGPEGNLRTEKVRIEGSRTEFRFQPGFAVRRVVLDPRYRIFRRPLPSDMRRPS